MNHGRLPDQKICILKNIAGGQSSRIKCWFREDYTSNIVDGRKINAAPQTGGGGWERRVKLTCGSTRMGLKRGAKLVLIEHTVVRR